MIVTNSRRPSTTVADPRNATFGMNLRAQQIVGSETRAKF